jgi:hypothetical protein
MSRKDKWFTILSEIKRQGYFDRKITNYDLEYILFLSYSVRVAYFQTKDSSSYNTSDYILIVNNLIKPYLSNEGLIIYEKWLKSFMLTSK